MQSAKSLANIEKVSLEFDFAFGSDQARIILLEVLEFREFVRHGSKAGLIATGRHPKLGCLVGPLDVVIGDLLPNDNRSKIAGRRLNAIIVDT
jgi:hypothetical protein